MAETTGETIDQGFADLEAGEKTIETEIAELSAEEARELAFLADLEFNRGQGQLAPDQQARLDDLKARQERVSAQLDKAREELAQADGSEPAPSEPQPVSEPLASETPIADSIPVPAEPAPGDETLGESQVGEQQAAEPAAVTVDDTAPDEEPAPNET